MTSDKVFAVWQGKKGGWQAVEVKGGYRASAIQFNLYQAETDQQAIEKAKFFKTLMDQES
jgi:hypothetical protein